MAVATTNLAQLRTELDAQYQDLLDYAPYREIITAPQTHDSRAIFFKILFGYIPEKWTEKQQTVWVLLYPPSKEGGYAEVQFHSCDPETKAFAKHDDRNISSTVTEFAIAFRTPKKGSKGKHVALAKYYYLKSLAALETRIGRHSELGIPIPLTRTFLDGLKVACREFEEAKGKVSNIALPSPPAPLEDDQVSDLSDPPEDLPEPAQPVQPSSMLPNVSGMMITPEMSPTLTHDDADANARRVEILVKIRDDEVQLQSSDSAIEVELAALEDARLEIEGRRRMLEEERQMNGKKKVRIAARREHFFNGMSVMDAFKLGGEVERAEKRLRLS